MSAVVLAAGLSGAGTASAATGWQPTILPVPDGWRGAAAVGTDGHGEYSGTLYDAGGGAAKLAIWRGGAPVLVDPPSGCAEVSAIDENAARVIVVQAAGCGGDGTGQRVYTYSGGAYHELAPVGATDALAVAVNQRGDVLGQDWPQPATTIVWRPAAEPIVIPNTMAGQWPVDIDDDGTVLFSTDAGSYLWRDGTMTALPVPDGFDVAWGSAIRGGVVVGGVAHAGSTESLAYWWPTLNAPQRLSGGPSAIDVNASGLVTGNPMTWEGGGPAGTLPIPAGYDTAGPGTVGDDGSIVGTVGLYDIDKPFDDPVVWRR